MEHFHLVEKQTIPKPSKAITTLVKLVIVPVNPCNIFILTPLFMLSIESTSIVNLS